MGGAELVAFVVGQSVDSLSVPLLLVLAIVGGALSIGASTGVLYATIRRGMEDLARRVDRVESVLFDSQQQRKK